MGEITWQRETWRPGRRPSFCLPWRIQRCSSVCFPNSRRRRRWPLRWTTSWQTPNSQPIRNGWSAHWCRKSSSFSLYFLSSNCFCFLVSLLLFLTVAMPAADSLTVSLYHLLKATTHNSINDSTVRYPMQQLLHFLIPQLTQDHNINK